MYIGKTRSEVMVIIFTLITCGIYAIYWFYVIMEDLNAILKRDYMSSVLTLILAIICPPVAWYILYKADQGLVEASAQHNIHYGEKFILWLLLSLIFGIGVFVAMIQMTDAFNKIWAARYYGQSSYSTGQP